MTNDIVLNERELRRQNRPGLWFYCSVAAVFVLSLLMYRREFGFELTDLSIHSQIAAEFDFSDLHTITSRLAYPLWHLMVACLYQLGLPLEWASPIICALCKTLTFVLAQRTLVGLCQGKIKENWLTLTAILLMIVTCIYIEGVNFGVYRGVGSPNVWHNPTQQAVFVAMLLCMPYLCHCWYEFERMLPEKGDQAMLPWGKVILLAILLMGSLACKPTFMQALLPAAFAMFLVELLRHKRNWRYFMQIILAFLPAVAYFLLQYLYYTGVVVEYTSGVEIGITAQSAWLSIRNTLMMSAFPLFAVICCYRKGFFKDRMVVLGLLMTLFSVIEAMTFRETGMREGHGNFTWAANSSSFFLWVTMTGVFLRDFSIDLRKKSLSLVRKLGYSVGFALLAWHVGSGIFYLNFLLTTQNVF
ncbi:MAG: hypothetical protein PHI98_13330 [Eubacteriales bacterium]|nr:hypothetical protein [Eubacteriales bacterium]